MHRKEPKIYLEFDDEISEEEFTDNFVSIVESVLDFEPLENKSRQEGEQHINGEKFDAKAQTYF